MPTLSNENLSLWLKARDGLPCEEARALIEQVHTIEADCDEALRKRESWVSPGEMDDAIEEARAAGRAEALKEARDWLLDVLESPKEHDETVLHIANALERMADGYTPEAVDA